MSYEMCSAWHTSMCLFVIVIICILMQVVVNAVKLSNKYYPKGVDYFEHEFPSILGAYLTNEYNPLKLKEQQSNFDYFDEPETKPQLFQGDIAIDPFTYLELKAQQSNFDYFDEPETKPQLFQGDIAIDPFTYISLRLGINPMKHPRRLWPNATIPYEISYLYTDYQRKTILNVLKTFNSLTCIKFIPYNGEVDDYLLITPPEDGPKGCWSYVGKKGGEQIVSLQTPDGKSPHCFSSEGRIMHELMHAIGIYHEQSRADRDNYVKVHWENIVPKFRKNFKLISRKRGKYAFDYDYNSVMHYGEYYFSKKKGKKPTLTPLQPGIRIGQRKTLTQRYEKRED
uniref:Metalloendopeptidase n=1 Tax=Glossina brevipalpis TaxID=37001 RepID=A0A1A9WTV5_9MUSC